METLFFIIALIFSVVIHEVSHGAMANALGDPTARYAGRLTLNPLKHLDPFGSVILPLTLLLISRLSGGVPFLIGWAKPVPYNPYNLKNQQWGPAAVGIAGPGSNIVLALAFGLPLRFAPEAFGTSLISLAPFFATIAFINVMLAVFNLVPIPPLDGSKLLYALFPDSRLRQILEQYGLFFLLLFLFVGFRFLTPIIFSLFRLIVGDLKFLF
ncbi:site-2 protease family protein [Candidatus Azambacteria bacterium]|nr:site-2 protease family protein [Candidatus Azambacteria bacterium]